MAAAVMSKSTVQQRILEKDVLPGSASFFYGVDLVLRE